MKILFHKNKEIKGTVVKENGFSLMCFITIFAFAFVVPSAMAAEFGLTVAGRTAARYILNAQGTEATAA